MRENRSTLEMLGALLGLVILIAVLYVAVGYFRQGATEFDEAARVAGRPVTLAESLSGITETTGLTETVVVTEAAVVTETAATTVTTATTETTATEPTVADSAAITATADVTPTTPVTASTELTVTQVATTTIVTATTTLTGSEGVTTTPVVTTTTVVTNAGAVTETGTITAASDVTTTVAAAPAPAEVAAIVTKGTCFACHVIPGVPNAAGQVGPNLSEIGVVGATRIPGYTAEQYIRESLLQPNDFIAPECPTGPCLPNLMVQNLGDTLTEEEIDTLVAYLATLGVAQ